MSALRLHYKGFEGLLRYSFPSHLWNGHILHIRDLIRYEGHSFSEMEVAFQAAVEDYLWAGKQTEGAD